jgi:hypothetical protein
VALDSPRATLSPHWQVFLENPGGFNEIIVRVRSLCSAELGGRDVVDAGDPGSGRGPFAGVTV